MRQLASLKQEIRLLRHDNLDMKERMEKAENEVAALHGENADLKAQCINKG